MMASIRGLALLAAVPVLLTAGAGRSAAQVVVGSQPVVTYYYAPPGRCLARATICVSWWTGTRETMPLCSHYVPRSWRRSASCRVR